MPGLAASHSPAGPMGSRGAPRIPAARGVRGGPAARAARVVTAGFPCFIVPGQPAALAGRAEVAVMAVGAGSVVPLSRLGATVSAAAHLRPRIHRAFAAAWEHRAAARPLSPSGPK